MKRNTLRTEEPERKLFTVYGDRGWNEESYGYIQDSLVRGYANLNAMVYEIQWLNPDVIIHSITQSNVVYPLHTPRMVRIFITFLYSGTIRDISTLPVFEADEDSGYDFHQGGTMLRVQL